MNANTMGESKWRHLTLVAMAIAGLLAIFGCRQAGAAGLLIADGGFGGQLEIEEHSVNVVINNGVAVTEVNQIFRNTENRQVEALYTFPVPKGASVSNFSMWIGGKEMIGEVLEKKRASEIYDSYKETRKDPGLLEQVDYRTFEMRIFPIGPNAAQRVQVVYYQELDFDNDWVTYVYPLATSTRPVVSSQTTGRFAINFETKSAIPIVEMESPSHRDDFVFAKHTADYQQASLEITGGSLQNDVVLAYKVSRPRTGVDMIFSNVKGDDGYFCLTMAVGEELSALRKGMDYVFVLDVSGSMANDGKLITSRDSIAAFIESLDSEDRFEVMTFNVQPSMLFSSLRAVDEKSMSDANTFLDSQQARGGTSLRPALSAAYKYGDPDRNLNVVILSDGMTEQSGRAELLRLIGARPANTRVFCVGVGNDVNRPLLTQLANDAGGLAAFVSRGDDFDRQAQSFRRKLTRPVATNLTFDFGTAGVYDIEPVTIPNLYHGAPIRVYGRYRGAGPKVVTFTGEVMGRELKQTAEFDFPTNDEGNPEIERMWAWRRVQRLLGQADRSGSRDQVIDEIVRLGEGYSIATEYTSFLVLENDGEYKRWKIERRNALRVNRDRAAQAATRNRLNSLREQALANLAPQQTTEPEVKKQVVQAPKKPAPGQTRTPSNTTSNRPRTNTRRSQGFDFGTGGGAIDPISGLLALLLGGSGLFAKLRRRK